MNLVKTDPRGRRHKTKWLLALAALVPVGVSVAGEVQQGRRALWVIWAGAVSLCLR